MKPPRLAVGCWSLCIAFGLLIGCQTTQEKKWTCDKAEVAYAIYRAYTADGATNIDTQVIADAQIAAAWLDTYCGWTPTASRDAAGRFVYRTSIDTNGVAIVQPNN